LFLEAKNGECACKAFVCNSANCGKAFSSGELWKAFRCVYDNSWEWVEAHPNNQVPTNFCCSDADCTAYKCDTTYYRCKQSCTSDADCKSGYYCYCYVCSSTFTSAGCEAGKCCNRGYGEAGIGSCVNAGTIYSNYLCDPPEWESNESS